MKMKHTWLGLLIGATGLVNAHDGGHGPKLSDTGKYGGVVSGVVLKTDAKKGEAASILHKAELVRSADGKVRLYIYDQAMTPVDLKFFDAKGTAILSAKVKGKYKESTFSIERAENSFVGRMPKPEGKPYNIDVTLKENGRDLLTAFDNLD